MKRTSFEFSEDDIFTRRPKIKGESFNPEEENFEPPFFEKSEKDKKIIRQNLRNHFLFKNLSSETMEIIIGAMFRVEVGAGEVVIREGEEGDYFYCIGSGVYEVDKVVDGERKLLGYYDHEGCFGELALMHKVGRAVSVTAARPGVLWALDRQTFQRTLLGRAFRRRSLYEDMLGSFPLLSTLTEQERANVVDSLVEITFNSGEVIFHEGDLGTGMYWILEGEVVLHKDDAELKRLGPGEYFGELALLHKKGRAVSAKASGRLKMVFLEADAFERLLGPCIHLMRQRLPDYQQEMARLMQKISGMDISHSNLHD